MDGHFVPNLSFGPGIQKHLRKLSQLFFDTHLMLTHPSKYIEPFAKTGSNLITIHVECEEDVTEVLDKIKALGVQCGLSLKPGTAIETLEPWLDRVDLVLVMTVEPGFGGQSFMDNGLPKIEWLAEQKRQKGYSYKIEVDGGINDVTGQKCLRAGAEVLVAGSYVYGAEDKAQAVASLRYKETDC